MGPKCTNCVAGKHSSVVELEKSKNALVAAQKASAAVDAFIAMAPALEADTELVKKAEAAKKEIESNIKTIEKRIAVLESDDEEDEDPEEDEEPEGDNEDYPMRRARHPGGSGREDMLKVMKRYRGD